MAALCAVSHYLNWGALPWMSRWLDEQYVTMSAAAMLAVLGCWWIFTRNASDVVVPEEPAPLLLQPALAGVAAPVTQEKKGKKKKR
jgi:hypothetical protein